MQVRWKTEEKLNNVVPLYSVGVGQVFLETPSPNLAMPPALFIKTDREANRISVVNLTTGVVEEWLREHEVELVNVIVEVPTDGC
jgi:hypothetical protein